MKRFAGLEAQRVRLRDFTLEDLPAFTAYRNDPDVARYQSWQDYDMARAEAFFETLQALAFGEPGWYQIAIADKHSDILLGDCVVHFFDGDEAQVEIGFTLASENQGKGYGAEAITTLLGYLFGTLGMHRVTAVTDVLNQGSVGLLERLGFRREAELIENIFFKGAWGSEYIYAMLAREFTPR